MLIPGPPLGLGGGIRTPCRMHSRNLIASRASESGTVNGHHTLVPAIPGHRLCAVLGPAHSPPHFRVYRWKTEAGKRKEKLPKEQSRRGRRWEEAANALLSLHSECFQENPAASAPRLRPHRRLGDERTWLPGAGHTAHRVSTWGINKHIWCSLSPTG